MHDVTRLVSNKKDLDRFIDLPFDIYKDSPYWVPPLKITVKDIFKPNHPFFDQAKIKSWVAEKDGKVVGRITAIVNFAHNEFHQEKCGFFGFFECIDDESIARELFKQAEDYLKAEGMEIVRGPVSPSTNYECGTLVEGFDNMPYLMMPYNFPYHETLITGQGYNKAKDLISYHLRTDFEMPEVFKRLAQRIQEKYKVTYRHINLKNWDHEKKVVIEIYNAAWEKNWGFIPMPPKEMEHLINEMKQLVEEKLITFALVDGKEVGFITVLPDYNQVFKQIPNGRLLPFGIFKLFRAKKYINRVRVLTLGILPEYRKMGIPTLLFIKAKEEAQKAGYIDAEMGWVLEDNLPMVKPLHKMGATPYKTYRIFEKTLK
ncbi:MAG: N-acetyltransferase [Epsilonproteobacteria bacterium]|nr:MAG: N-acetyltransferase [Campylobacterota bacterium]RLA67325.1 MAG: N-acetyltransferase [Campylobacterota bacterium]